MPVKCRSNCGRNAILKRPKTGDSLCKECFFWAFETEIHHTITKGQLFKRGSTVAIAASGGKDSTVLAHVLKTLNEKYDYGLRLVLLSIDEGITGYRDDSLDTVKQNRDDYGMELKILSYEDLYGWTMDKIVAQIGKRNNCTFCGVFRRQALDRGAALLNVDSLATGHNADDIAETILMNIMRGDVARLQRCTSVSSESEGSIPRVKPLKYSYEKEIVMYAYFKRLVYFSTECIYAPNAYRGHARAFLKDLEKIRPTAIMDIIHSGEQMIVKDTVAKPIRGTCTQCGFVSSQDICKACTLLEGLNKGMPKLGIGKTSKVKKALSSLNSEKMTTAYPWISTNLDTPSLAEVRDVLARDLKKTFDYVDVEVVDCPDLTEEPFFLAGKGLGGETSLIDLGGPPYLLPLVKRDKVYDFKPLVKQLKVTPSLLMGACAGPWPYFGKNCEGVCNILIDGDNVTSGSYVGKVTDGDEKLECLPIPSSETRFALMANLYCSQGKPGKVLKVNCKKRTGQKDFITAIRTGLAAGFPNKYVGLGGAFLLKEGRAKQHVMRDFTKTPINTEEELNNWLTFHDMSAPLVAVGTLISNEVPDFDLRVQHFHSFSKHNEAGHYHYDTTPETVEYLGYFNVAERLHRVDKPQQTHQLGRD
ncbi:hypothetical protein GE061_018127 [Apolygus lucorum]|uniref:Cytoplasmic tRNA 2-thiolation protein 1 n=1 Tax=Apolygus lucorum TaxID=248454 RepID=A0A6A4J7I0_APOLU|nr:hypothetical protein GE061_018127 [Apolygus lucorum]